MLWLLIWCNYIFEEFTGCANQAPPGRAEIATIAVGDLLEQSVIA